MDAGPVTGQRFGSYRLVALLGRGGMGVVYRAEHEVLRRTVALKLLTPKLAKSPGFRDRFLRESRLAASLDHPSVVPVYDAGESGGTLYMAMRFVPGTDLAALLRGEGALAPERAVAMLAQVADALDAAHALGLVHRDVKPANVLIEGQRCFLTDFGLTKPIEGATALTAAGQFLGTVDYVSPEQIEGDPVDGRADVYALGGVLLECLTGARPYPGKTGVAALYAHLRDPPPCPTERRPDLPAEIDAVVARAMAKPPAARFASCRELMEAARAALESPARQATAPRRVLAASPPAEQAPATAPATAPAAVSRGQLPTAPLPVSAPPPPAAPHRPARRRRLGLVAALVAAAAVVVAAIVALSSGGGGGSSGEGSGPRVVGQPIPVGSRPFGVAYAAGALWVANNSDDTVTRVSPESGRTSEIAVGRAPFGVTSAGASVWVVDTAERKLERIDASSGQLSAPLDVGPSPYYVAISKNRIYVTNGGDDTITEFYLGSGKLRRAPFPTGSRPRGIVHVPNGVWVANSGDGTASHLTHGVTRNVVKVGRNPVGIASGNGAIWVANKDSNTVSRIDAANPRAPVRNVRVGRQPFGIAVGEGFVWVTNSGDDTVTRLDPSTGRPVGDPIRVAGQPVGVTVGGGSVWVTANDRDALVRIAPR